MTVVAGPAAGLLVAADGGARDLHAAERLLGRLSTALGRLTGAAGAAGAAPRWATTHLVPGAGVVVAATWDPVAGLDLDRSVEVADLLADDAGLAGVSLGSPVTAAALAEHRRGSSGRLVVFPGSTALEELGRPTTVEEVLATSAIDAVESLAGTTPAPGGVLDLRGHVRPAWTARGCVLLVQQARHGLVPFEVRDQRPCCAAH